MARVAPGNAACSDHPEYLGHGVPSRIDQHQLTDPLRLHHLAISPPCELPAISTFHTQVVEQQAEFGRILAITRRSSDIEADDAVMRGECCPQAGPGVERRNHT
jgi:hypothetical protein